MRPKQTCEHISNVRTLILTDGKGCAECLKVGSEWVHLRTCQTCGVTLCCDSSPNKHATKHYHASGHPVVSSAEKGERWLWCYKDEQFAEY